MSHTVFKLLVDIINFVNNSLAGKNVSLVQEGHRTDVFPLKSYFLVVAFIGCLTVPSIYV